MKTLIDAHGHVLGVFADITVGEDRYTGSNGGEVGSDFPFNAVGNDCTIMEGTPAPTPAPVDRPALVSKLDNAVIAVYDKPMKLAKEYEDREAAAQAYKAAGYSGTVPDLVAGFATPAGMAPQAATDLILTQAAQLRGALPLLANLRMRKYAILRAASDSAAQQEYDSAIAAVEGIAAQLG